MARIDSRTHFEVARFIFEIGIKLEAEPQTIATAACIYHRFFEQCQNGEYDQHMVATTAMYLAGKAEEHHMQLKDIINVAFKTIHKDSGPLDPDNRYWALRDTVVNLELLILRILKFQVAFVHPHKYLLHYVKSLTDWLHPDVVGRVPLLSTSWAFVQDLCHDPAYLKHQPQHIAIAALYLTMQCYGVQVPYNDDAVLTWYESFTEDLSKDNLWDIVEDIMRVSMMEPKLPFQEDKTSDDYQRI